VTVTVANKPVNMPMPTAEMTVTARKPHPPAIEHDALTSVPQFQELASR
jgi:hypothetical protein